MTLGDTKSMGWIEWAGGECPVAHDTQVEIESDDGYRAVGAADLFLAPANAGADWWAENVDRIDALGRSRRHPDAIIAYRVIEQPK